jgi:hypothetical protein
MKPSLPPKPAGWSNASNGTTPPSTAAGSTCCELGILSSQCLDRRIPDKQTLIDEIAAWQHDRNSRHTKANWHFTTANARIKLRHLYCSI